MASDIQRLPGDVLNENGGRFANTYTANTWENVNTFSSTTYIDQNAYIRKGAWLIYDSNNASMSLEAMPAAAIPARGQIQGYALKKPYNGSIGQFLQLTASGPNWANPPGGGGGGASAESILENVQTFYDNKARPYDYTAGPHIPKGWYRIEVLMIATSPPGIKISKILNANKVANGRICSVMGWAYPGSISDNAGTPYISYDGLDWLTQTGGIAGSIGKTASSLRISFLYKHEGEIWEEPDWMDSARMSPTSDISLMSVRYTRIGLAPEESRWYTTKVPTEAPTSPPTEVTTSTPTEGPTDVTTEVPTEGPTDPPTEPPTDVPTDPPTDPPTLPPTHSPASLHTNSPS